MITPSSAFAVSVVYDLTPAAHDRPTVASLSTTDAYSSAAECWASDQQQWADVAIAANPRVANVQGGEVGGGDLAVRDGGVGAAGGARSALAARDDDRDVDRQPTDAVNSQTMFGNARTFRKRMNETLQRIEYAAGAGPAQARHHHGQLPGRQAGAGTQQCRAVEKAYLGMQQETSAQNEPAAFSHYRRMTVANLNLQVIGTEAETCIGEDYSMVSGIKVDVRSRGRSARRLHPARRTRDAARSPGRRTPARISRGRPVTGDRNCGARATAAAASGRGVGRAGARPGARSRASQRAVQRARRSSGRTAAAVVWRLSPMASPTPTAQPASSSATRIAVEALYVNSVQRAAGHRPQRPRRRPRSTARGWRAARTGPRTRCRPRRLAGAGLRSRSPRSRRQLVRAVACRPCCQQRPRGLGRLALPARRRPAGSSASSSAPRSRSKLTSSSGRRLAGAASEPPRPPARSTPPPGPTSNSTSGAPRADQPGRQARLPHVQLLGLDAAAPRPGA